MAHTISIKSSTVTIYKYPLKNRAPYWMPIFIVDVPLTSTDIKNDRSIKFSDGSAPYGGATMGDAGLSKIPLPFWAYFGGSGDTAFRSLYLEIYSDDYFLISTRDISNTGWGGRFSCRSKDNTVTIFSNDFTTRQSYTEASMMSCVGVHTTDDRYYCCGMAGGAQAATWLDTYLDISTVPKSDSNKGTLKFRDGARFVKDLYVAGPSDAERNLFEAILGKTKKYIIPDPDDPNPGGGDSKPGGGGGDGDIGGDTNPDDGLPTISALDSGLLTAYNPTVAELQSLGRFLWSDSFDISTFKKLFNDPFDTLLGLSVVPVKPTTSGTKTIMFGNMDSGVSAPVVANQWVPKDMGSVTLNEVWKGALDYAPSTGVTIYLPFIGMRQLNVNDVMGSTLHLIYKFDVLTGACIAQIYVNHSSQGNKDDGFSWTKDQGLLYEFIGQCAENIPLASQDFTNTIRAAIGGVAVATGAAASIATGNPALGIAGLTVGAANLGMQASTPTVERGGHLSGSASILGYSQPFLIVERPHQCKPSRYNALRGVPSQVYTSKLASCTRFTQITANNNLHIAGATDTELTELQNLLVSGVYFPDKKR